MCTQDKFRPCNVLQPCKNTTEYCQNLGECGQMCDVLEPCKKADQYCQSIKACGELCDEWVPCKRADQYCKSVNKCRELGKYNSKANVGEEHLRLFAKLKDEGAEVCDTYRFSSCATAPEWCQNQNDCGQICNEPRMIHEGKCMTREDAACDATRLCTATTPFCRDKNLCFTPVQARAANRETLAAQCNPNDLCKTPPRKKCVGLCTMFGCDVQIPCKKATQICNAKAFCAVPIKIASPLCKSLNKCKMV